MGVKQKQSAAHLRRMALAGQRMRNSQRLSTVSQQSVQAKQRADRAERRLVEVGKQAVAKELDSLLSSGRCTAAEHNEWMQRLATIRMSLTSDGSLERTEVQQFVDNRRALPEGAMWPSTRRMGLDGKEYQVVEHPQHATGTYNEAQARQVVDDMESRHPGRFKTNGSA